jgi:sulfur carrier protein ThiS
MTITVNGREEKLHIGCRTFVSLDEMLKLLESSAKEVKLNGKHIPSKEYVDTYVNRGDSLFWENTTNI